MRGYRGVVDFIRGIFGGVGDLSKHEPANGCPATIVIDKLYEAVDLLSDTLYHVFLIGYGCCVTEAVKVVEEEFSCLQGLELGNEEDILTSEEANISRPKVMKGDIKFIH